jgi:hypothetical protein
MFEEEEVLRKAQEGFSRGCYTRGSMSHVKEKAEVVRRAAVSFCIPPRAKASHISGRR